MGVEWNVERLRGANELKRESLVASVSFASATLRGLFILNGAAAVALLAFLAEITSKDAVGNLTAIAQGVVHSLVWFSIGSAISVATSFIAYFAQENITGS